MGFMSPHHDITEVYLTVCTFLTSCITSIADKFDTSRFLCDTMTPKVAFHSTAPQKKHVCLPLGRPLVPLENTIYANVSSVTFTEGILDP